MTPGGTWAISSTTPTVNEGDDLHSYTVEYDRYSWRARSNRLDPGHGSILQPVKQWPMISLLP